MAEKILLQFDVDSHASSFDAIVAIDAGVDRLLQYDSVEPSGVESLVHGAMFTRGGDELKSTAIFVGGNDVNQAEELFGAVQKAFFGPVRVSVMLDASGCNTTAAAAVASITKHMPLEGATCAVLGGTGPVGRRVAHLLTRQGAHVIVTSRSLKRAESACHDIAVGIGASDSRSSNLEAAAPESDEAKMEMLGRVDAIVACGAAGVELLSAEELGSLKKIRVAIDLNAVPPAGIGGVEAFDKAKRLRDGDDDSPIVYGPIGVGGLKMRTHKAAIAKLFENNDVVLDANEIYDLTIEQMG
ncbi:bifunctional NADP-dependent methylenetetrahydromethanopterin dehydrogenase/methylenetetrahydrofolate dehydrogenase [Rhodopirellula sp. SWK7]|uniref:bifunctional NADP-dependent methylenetetrahydromethanopterin dehydrogenase/methylenetetrahydrofolate dehydrogenase n=1 Tax=Rhodopirellula sp. SWK7 TaxID=595460 RepID=UPI0002BF2FB4|nr:bifunctional NADP-dependent methylenetetrahydromethanopterin dehydrogenase/methylenetetrahydrofolate dehydrogenase [Rhodopirellula sp. SWK7]EMI45625.1 Methylenetetrahydrofolate dehydrogenase (NADP(+)) [Rhodopirellula sp. SWK7]